MKLSILTAASAWGGAEIHTVGLAETLKNRGHDVFVVQLGHDIYGRMGWQDDKRGKLLRLEISKPLSDLSLWESRRLLGTLSADACIFAKNTSTIGNLAFELAARLHFSRYITIEHMIPDSMPPKRSGRHLGSLVPGLGLWWIRLYLSRFLRCLPPHRVICVSDAIRKRLVEEYRFPAAKVTTIYSGIDPLRFQKNDKTRRQVRSAWGIPENAFVFGAVGRLSGEKGYDLAIEAFRQLISGLSLPHRPIRLVLIGEGRLRSTLEKASREAGLEELILFPGFTDRPWEAYSAFDIFIMPSRTEGLGLALLEAMACSCCPIAMGVGGVVYVLTDPMFGWLVAPGDTAGFLAAMRAAAESNTDTLVEMGQKAREHVISCFNSRIQYQALAEFIERESNGLPSRIAQRSPKGP